MLALQLLNGQAFADRNGKCIHRNAYGDDQQFYEIHSFPSFLFLSGGYKKDDTHPLLADKSRQLRQNQDLTQYVGIATRQCADYSLIPINYTEKNCVLQLHILGQKRESVQKSNTFFSVRKFATFRRIVR